MLRAVVRRLAERRPAVGAPALLFGYAVAVVWRAPALLRVAPLAARRARFGVAAWLTAMAALWPRRRSALELLARAAITAASLAEVVCRSVSGPGDRNRVPGRGRGVRARGAAIVAVLAAAVLAWRYGRSVQRAERQTRAHADAARITGHGCPATTTPWFDGAQPVAYCLPGRPATIVVSSGALAVLDQGSSPPCSRTSGRTWPAATTC